jgi:iron-sulfur cluster assembly accessory protein
VKATPILANLDFYVRFGYFEQWLRADKPDLASKTSAKEGKIMIEMSSEAIAKVKSILSERKEEAGLRIAIIGGGCSGFQYQMTLDKEPQKGDEVFDMEGLKVFIDSKSLLYLNGAKVDYVNGTDGSGFKFDNPNAKATCGCGDSFEA